MDSNKTVKEIFGLVKNKIKIPPSKLRVTQKVESNNFYRSSFGNESEEVNINMPVKYLKSNELLVYCIDDYCVD